MHLKLPVYVIIVIFFYNEQDSSLDFLGFWAKSFNSTFFQQKSVQFSCDSDDVMKTLL